MSLSGRYVSVVVGGLPCEDGPLVELVVPDPVDEPQAASSTAAAEPDKPSATARLRNCRRLMRLAFKSVTRHLMSSGVGGTDSPFTARSGPAPLRRTARKDGSNNGDSRLLLLPERCASRGAQPRRERYSGR